MRPSHRRWRCLRQDVERGVFQCEMRRPARRGDDGNRTRARWSKRFRHAKTKTPGRRLRLDFFGSLVWVFLPRLDACRRTVELLLQEGGVFAGHHGVQNCLESVAAPQAMPAREGQRRVLVVRNALPPPLHSTAGVCFVSSSSRGRSDKIPGWLHESINEGNFV